MNRAKVTENTVLEFHLQNRFKFCIRAVKSLYFSSVNCTCLYNSISQLFIRESFVEFDIYFPTHSIIPPVATLLIASVNTEGQTWDMIGPGRLRRQ